MARCIPLADPLLSVARCIPLADPQGPNKNPKALAFPPKTDKGKMSTGRKVDGRNCQPERKMMMAKCQSGRNNEAKMSAGRKSMKRKGQRKRLDLEASFGDKIAGNISQTGMSLEIVGGRWCLHLLDERRDSWKGARCACRWTMARS